IRDPLVTGVQTCALPISNTVAQASVEPLDPLMNCPNLVSLRVVIDVGAWSESRFALPGGQSGNPASRHYSDQFPHWQSGAGVPRSEERRVGKEGRWRGGG